MRRNETLLDVLLEAQILDRVSRSGWALRGVADGESVSEHAYQVLLCVWALGREIDDLDLGRALEIALVHDLAEARLGDLPRTASRYLGREAKHRAEEAAAEEMLGPLGAEGRELLASYHGGETREARFVRACDKLQLMLKVHHYERWGAAGLAEFWDNPANFPDDEFPAVLGLVEELRARRSGSAGSPLPREGEEGYNGPDG